MSPLLEPKDQSKNVSKSSSEPPKKKKRREKNRDSSDISLVLHTQTAANFFKQSWFYENAGLRRFSRTTQLLWIAAKKGDPYAEWHLMQIYDAIGAWQESFEAFEKHYETYLHQKRGFEVILFDNPEPFRFGLQFSNPFAYLGAQLFADVDYALRQSYTLRKIGILLPDDCLPYPLMSQLRNLFEQGSDWQYTVITREDIQQHNQKAKEAEEKMGKLPQVVLNREIKFGLLPKILPKKY